MKYWHLNNIMALKIIIMARSVIAFLHEYLALTVDYEVKYTGARPKLHSRAILLRPFACSLVVLGPVVPVELCDFRDQGVVRVWVVQQGANGKENFGNSESRAPLVLQNVEANSTRVVDVAVIDSRSEGNFGWLERIVGCENKKQKDQRENQDTPVQYRSVWRGPKGGGGQHCTM
jgi:hypothetical protein